MIELKTKREINYMKDAGKIVAKAHQEVSEAIKDGITTLELDQIAEDVINKAGAIPAFKGYQGFPASICASINEEVVHGIPSLKKLKNGDIVSVDIGAAIHGYYGDAARTNPVGEVDEEIKRLIAVTQQSLQEGIAAAVINNRISDIGHAVQTYVEKRNFSVVRDYVGHGIGKKMHEEPQVPNFGSPGYGPRLRAGIALAIEPMVNMGTYEVETLEDNWTVVTKDRKPSAHFEDTIAVTNEGPVVLTKL